MNSGWLSAKDVNRRSTFESFLFMTIGVLLAHQTEVTGWLANYLEIPIDIISGAVGFIFYVLKKIIMPNVVAPVVKETTITATTTTTDLPTNPTNNE